MKSKMPAHDARDEVLEQLAAVLAERGDLLPTEMAHVAREEADLDPDLELPDSLRLWAPRPPAAGAAGTLQGQGNARGPGSVRAISARPKTPWLNYAGAALFGAAAATALFVSRAPRDEGSLGIAPSGERTARVTPVVPPAPRIELSAEACGNGCCAGASCASASADLRECPSGRACVGCGTLSGEAQSGEERFRLKLGSLALTPEGSKARDANAWDSLELCLRVGSSDFSCAPAHRNGDADRTWTALPLVASSQDGLAGFELQIRARGKGPVASWGGPVAINPTVLCKGLVLKPKFGDSVLGTVSLFLDDTHYVELGRGTSLRTLTESGAVFAGTRRPRIFQRAGREPSFALSVGPVGYAEAERLRASVLRQGGDARIVLGLDYVDELAR